MYRLCTFSLLGFQTLPHSQLGFHVDIFCRFAYPHDMHKYLRIICLCRNRMALPSENGHYCCQHHHRGYPYSVQTETVSRWQRLAGQSREWVMYCFRQTIYCLIDIFVFERIQNNTSDALLDDWFAKDCATKVRSYTTKIKQAKNIFIFHSHIRDSLPWGLTPDIALVKKYSERQSVSINTNLCKK